MGMSERSLITVPATAMSHSRSSIPVNGAVLAALESLSPEELMQCKKRAEYRGVSLLDQLELQLVYESPEPTPEVEYHHSARVVQSCTVHLPGSSSNERSWI